MRASIDERARGRGRDSGPVNLQRVFVIGDTPYDVEAANTIGVKTIEVATGGY